MPFQKLSKYRSGADWRGASVLVVVVAVGGCGTDSVGIDARSNRLVQLKTAGLGGGATPPERHFRDPDFLDSGAIYQKNPPSVNPGAADLKFTVAKEARDVAARLAAYQAIDTATARHMTLTDALSQAQKTAREHLNQEEEYILAAISLLMERHLWGPRFFADSSATFSSTQVDGDSTTALAIVNQLRATQRLPYGGEVAAKWVWNATENLRSSATGQYRQSSALVFDASIPLLRGAGLVAQESLIQAERSLVYAARNFESFRRQFLVSISRDYFALLQQQAGIENSKKQLASLVAVEKKQKALFDAGRIRQLDVNNAANQVLQARASVANLEDGLVFAVDQFKIRLGLALTTPVVIDASGLEVPEPDISLEEATLAALDYRLDLQNERDRVDDARRGTRNARNQLLPDFNLAGNVTFPTDASAREGGLVYEPDDVAYSAGATFSLPLDREIERLQLKKSAIGLERTIRNYDKFRDTVVLDVRQRVRAIELAQFNLRLAVERVKISELRVKENQIREDEIDTQEKLNALNDLLAAENARDQAITALRNSVLDYLVSTGQLRVTRDGQFQPLPGMEGAPAVPVVPPGENPPAEPPELLPGERPPAPR